MSTRRGFDVKSHIVPPVRDWLRKVESARDVTLRFVEPLAVVDDEVERSVFPDCALSSVGNCPSV